VRADGESGKISTWDRHTCDDNEKICFYQGIAESDIISNLIDGDIGNIRTWVKIPDGTSDISRIRADVWGDTKAGWFVNVPIEYRDMEHPFFEPCCCLKNFFSPKE